MRQELLGSLHPSVATSLNNLALLYYSQGRYEEAEPLYLKALKIAEQLLEVDHPNRFIFRENYKLCLKAKKSKPRSAKNKGFGRSPTMK
jgi:tetratricopeptide (TPR) repeat protein